jgi:hypothetical protein
VQSVVKATQPPTATTSPNWGPTLVKFGAENYWTPEQQDVLRDLDWYTQLSALPTDVGYVTSGEFKRAGDLLWKVRKVGNDVDFCKSLSLLTLMRQ